MQEAGPMNFLRTILILFAIYYGVKLVSRYVLPFILKRWLHKMQTNAQKFQSNQSQQTKVGETVIDKKPPSQKSSNSSVGDYVDYEEID